jgi:hypothetical protein
LAFPLCGLPSSASTPRSHRAVTDPLARSRSPIRSLQGGARSPAPSTRACRASRPLASGPRMSAEEPLFFSLQRIAPKRMALRGNRVSLRCYTEPTSRRPYSGLSGVFAPPFAPTNHHWTRELRYRESLVSAALESQVEHNQALGECLIGFARSWGRLSATCLGRIVTPRLRICRWSSRSAVVRLIAWPTSPGT